MTDPVIPLLRLLGSPISLTVEAEVLIMVHKTLLGSLSELMSYDFPS